MENTDATALLAEWDALILKYIKYCKGEYKPATVKSYGNQIRLLRAYVEKEAIPLVKFRAPQLKNYITYRAGEGGRKRRPGDDSEGVAKVTRNYDARIIRSLLRLGLRNGIPRSRSAQRLQN